MLISTQLFKYASVGVISNVVLYGLYLILTVFGLDPKLAVTGLYALGVLLTFVFNRSWTFRHYGSVPKALWKYVLVYLSGYLINLIILYIFVDRLGFYHAYVQGAAIPTVAIYLFLIQKQFVFSETDFRAVAKDSQDVSN